jgi:ankyrin repeat protein
LHYAALVGSFEIAEALVNGAANLNLQDHIGQTPLHYSVIQKQDKITRMLMRKYVTHYCFPLLIYLFID